MAEAFGSKGVCLDATHNSTRYNLKLITMLVLDKRQKGQATFYCKEENESNIITYCGIKNHRDFPLKPDIIMINNAVQYWMTWVKVFGEYNTKDYCVIGMLQKTGWTDVHLTIYKENQIFYINQKRYYSINVQAICGPDREFYNIVVKYPGSTHDSRIFTQSAICRDFESGWIRGMLVGDAGYACKPYLLTSYNKPARNRTEGRFNKYHAKTRVCIKQAFGCLKWRFHVIHGEIRLPDPNKVCTIIASCCSLISTILLTIVCLKSIKQTISKEEAALDHWCAIILPAI
uniref:DDE Tnp4 domain-containing protein n=1 Tax=Plectus sambesii TaxID=2011161 RepID=A0A914UW91_9BILA